MRRCVALVVYSAPMPFPKATPRLRAVTEACESNREVGFRYSEGDILAVKLTDGTFALGLIRSATLHGLATSVQIGSQILTAPKGHMFSESRGASGDTVTGDVIPLLGQVFPSIEALTVAIRPFYRRLSTRRPRVGTSW